MLTSKILLALSIVLILALLKGVIFLDSDFGWHLRLGKHILDQGVPSSDPFSFTMPSFAYIDHEWLSNILLSFFYNASGQVGLATIFALLTVVALFLRIFQVKKHYLILTAISTVCLLAFTGIRVQVVGWVLFCLLLVFLTLKQQALRLLLIPFLFLVWANMHGSFPLGLIILFICQLNSYLAKQTTFFYSIVMVIGSVLATFFNPYGINLYQESLTTITDSSLHWVISEWSPLLSNFNIAIITYVILAVIFYQWFGDRKKRVEVAIFYLLLCMSLVSIRHFPFFLLYSLPFITKAVISFEKKVSAVPYGKKRFAASYLVFSILISFGLLLQMIIIGKDSIALSETNYYPKRAAAFLQARSEPHRIFAPYNWGGYLLMKVSESKLFIDGRMPSWTNPQAPHSESQNAFAEYQRILNGKIPLGETISKYAITSFVLPTQENNKEYSILYLQLSNLNWKKSYSDSTATVLTPP